MRRNLEIVISAVLAFVLAFCGIGSAAAYAAEKNTSETKKHSSKTYKYVVEDFSKRVVGSKSTVEVDCYSMRLELSGYGKAGKKINKQLKNIVQPDPENVFAIAELMAENEYSETIVTLYDRVRTWVTYNDGKYLSVTLSREAWTGGVENAWATGYTFSLKTGKPVPITKATGWSLEQIKQRLSDNMKADGDAYDDHSFQTLSNMKEEDFHYSLKEGNICIVTFEPYEIGFGGWFRTFEFEY